VRATGGGVTAGANGAISATADSAAIRSRRIGSV
jgi:hypothetical protein